MLVGNRYIKNDKLTFDKVAIAIITKPFIGWLDNWLNNNGSIQHTLPRPPENKHFDSTLRIPKFLLKFNSKTEPALSLTIAKFGKSVNWKKIT